VQTIGGPGIGSRYFTGVSHVAVDHQGIVYVSDLQGILVFDSDGRYLHTIRDVGVAAGMTFNDQNELIVVTSTPIVLQYVISE
jgi:hypothetical protein